MMIKLIQISDLHFGALDHSTLEPLLYAVKDINPSALIITGDLTQRAKSKEFIAAKEFLKKMEYPKLIIPGNHDIPLYNVFSRFIKPLNKYLFHISDKVLPELRLEKVHVVGVNTARSLTIKNGRLSKNNIKCINELFCEKKENEMVNILALHHNFISVDSSAFTSLVGRSRLLLEKMKDCKLDIILTGHVHKAYTKVIQNPHHKQKSTIIVSAGTATSHRRKRYPNSFNEIMIEGDYVKVSVHDFINGEFSPRTSISYKKTDYCWSKA